VTVGLFKKLTGGVDEKLLQTGALARGTIMGVRPSGTTLQSGNGLVERKCEFQVQVTLDGQAPYEATCTQRVPEVYLPQFQPGASVVAVRVDPQDRSRIVLDLASEPPNVRVGREAGAPSAADILATGRPAKAVIVQSQPLGMRNEEGVDIHAFVLTVMPDGQQPYQTQVGNPTPAEALPLLFPGSHVPVRVGATPDHVVIDWRQALAEAGGR
jgi:hypothetical protein